MGTFLSCWFACPAPLKGARFMLCAVFSWSPLAYGRVPYPPYARYGMGRLCGERRADGASVASALAAQETRLGAGGGESRRNYALPAPSEAPPRAPCARTSPATRTAQAFRMSKGAKGSVCPVGCCAQRKATRRREQIQGLCAAAHRTPIFAKGRKARMIEQPGRKKRGSSQNQGFFNDLSAALPQWKGGALRQALANLPRTLSICCCWACSLGYQPWAAIFW